MVYILWRCSYDNCDTWERIQEVYSTKEKAIERQDHIELISLFYFEMMERVSKIIDSKNKHDRFEEAHIINNLDYSEEVKCFNPEYRIVFNKKENDYVLSDGNYSYYNITSEEVLGFIF